MTEYFEEYQCTVCGMRECIHKANDAAPNLVELADINCNACYGKGYTVYDDMVKGPKTLICHCLQKGYIKYMEKRIELPCSLCGKAGLCVHRPPTIEHYLEMYGGKKE